MSSPLQRRILFGLFFLSGACGLIYEIVWTRMLTLVFGVTVYAVSAVLCAFMLGLALGSLAFGRLADRSRRPLRLYGLLELGIAAGALLLPFLLEAVKPAFIALYPYCASHTLVFAFARFFCVLPILLVPTFLMGGTLPLLSRHFINRRGDLNRGIGLLYGINTAGAVAGTFLAGFVLLAQLGIRQTIAATAALNVLVGLLALGLARRAAPAPAAAGAPGEPAEAAPAALPDAAPAPADPFAVSRSQGRLVLAAIALSGFASLGLEVLWTRLLVFHVQNSTYAFSAMLMVFLTGLALGSWLWGLLAARLRRPLLLFGLIEAGIGLWTIGSMAFNTGLLRVNGFLLRVLPLADWNKAIVVILIESALVLLAPTVLMGITIPLATRLATVHVGELGRKLGLVYCANTLGTVAGSFAVGFMLIPLAGLRNSFLAVAALNLGLGAWLMLAARPAARPLRWGGALACAALLAAAPFAIPRDIMKRVYSRVLGRLVYYNEEITDTIMVVDFPDQTGKPSEACRWLAFSDGRGTAGIPTRQGNHYTAHLPMLLHAGNPRHALVICIGAGNSVGAFKQYRCLETIDCADLSAGIPKAAQYFKTNEGAFTPPLDPRIRFHAEDGRAFLQGSRRKFDVIQLDPPELHTAGVVFLYTREFYEICRRSLNPGGILMQWVNTWRLSAEEMRTLCAAFQQVFPDGMLWQSPTLGHLYLIGSPDPLRLSLKRAERMLEREPDARRQMERDNLDDLPGLFSLLLLNDKSLKQYCAGAPACTDDKTILDFSSPKTTFGGYGLLYLFSPVKPVTMGGFALPGAADPREWERSAWLETIRLTARTDSVAPLLDWTGCAPAEIAAARRRIQERIEQRQWLIRFLDAAFSPGSTQEKELWLGDMIRPAANPRLAYTLIPRLSGACWRTAMRSNSLGLRGAAEIGKKPAGTRRILALGDSVTFGAGVEESGAWPARLQEGLEAASSSSARIEVVNMGVPGYNAVQKTELFARLGLALEPDAVIVQADPQDASVAPFLARSSYAQQKEKLDNLVFADLFTVLLHRPGALRWRDYGQPMPTRPEQVAAPLRPLVGGAAMSEAYTRLARLCAGRRIPLLALLPPLPEDAAGSDVSARQGLAELFGRLGVPVLDVQDAVGRQARQAGLTPGELFFDPRTDTHPTAAQHDLIARAVLNGFLSFCRL